MAKQTKKKRGKKTVAKKPAAKKVPTKQVPPEEIMDRSALKSIAAQLKEMGSDIKVLKSDTDELLQRKVNDELQKLPSGKVSEKLGSIVPSKLISVLKKDCIGIFIDLADVSCRQCSNNEQCAKMFIANLKGDMSMIDGALPDATPEQAAKKVVAKITPVTRYVADRAVFIRDRKNPNPPGDDYHDTFARVLHSQPDTLEELRDIIADEFEIESDADFMKFVTTMRDPTEGIVMLDVDLTAKHKAALKAAGYEF